MDGETAATMAATDLVGLDKMSAQLPGEIPGGLLGSTRAA